MEFQIVSVVDAVDQTDAAAVAATLPGEVLSCGPYVPLLMFGQPVPRLLESAAWAVIACRASADDVAALEAAGLDYSKRKTATPAEFHTAPGLAGLPPNRSNPSYKPATDWNATAESVAEDIATAPKAGGQ